MLTSCSHQAATNSLYDLRLISLSVQPFPVGLVIWWPGDCVVSSPWDSYSEAFHSCHTLCCCSSLFSTGSSGWTDTCLTVTLIALVRWLYILYLLMGACMFLSMNLNGLGTKKSLYRVVYALLMKFIQNI